MKASEWSHHTLDESAVCPICNEGDTHARPIQGDGMHHTCGDVAEAREKVTACRAELVGLVAECEDLERRLARELGEKGKVAA